MNVEVEALRTSNPLVNKLGRFVPLKEDERDALRHLGRNARWHSRGSDLIAEGDKPDSVFLLLEGWAFRYKQLEAAAGRSWRI